jgi:hypothetical protein
MRAMHVRKNCEALEGEARRLRSDDLRTPIKKIAQQLQIRPSQVTAWVRDIDADYMEKIRPQLRADFLGGALIVQLARRYKLDLIQAKALVVDLFQAELDRLGQLLLERPDIRINELSRLFPRWTERAIYHNVHKILPTAEVDTYTPPNTSDEYANVFGLAAMFDVTVGTVQAVVTGSSTIRLLKVLKKGKKKPYFYYLVADLLREYPRFGRYQHVRASLERNKGHILKRLPDDLRMSSWVVLLTFLLFRRKYLRRPTINELFAAIDRSYRYTKKTIENGLEELKRTGYLVARESEVLATTRCPIEFIANEPENLPGFHSKVRAYFDFVVSTARVVIVESQPVRSDSKTDSPLKRRWRQYSETTRQEEYESL